MRLPAAEIAHLDPILFYGCLVHCEVRSSWRSGSTQPEELEGALKAA